MVDPLPIDPQQTPGLGGSAGPSGIGGKPSTSESAASKAGGVEFSMLLERLEARASDLAQETRGVDGPDELGRAVDTARASLEEALSLKDQLLEAYRQAERQGGAQPGKAAG